MPSIKVRKYGNSVYVIYVHRNQKLKVYTGVKVDDLHWNLSVPRKSCPNYDNVLAQINQMETRLLNASMKVRTMGIDPTVDRVRMELKAQEVVKEAEKPFWEIYNTYLLTRTFKPPTRQKVEIHKKMLQFFCTWSGYEFDIKTWDKLAFGRLIQYLLFTQKMADSTIDRLVRGVKAFLRFAYPTVDLSWMKYKLLSTEETVVALSDGELKYLIDADLGGYLEKTRDLFVFLATTGMRFSDSQLFNPTWVTEEQILEFNQHKTGGKAYPPLYEVSRRILSKYNGIPPQISNQKFNDYLKVLFEELKFSRSITSNIVRNKVVFTSVAPLSEVISSHTARRTFISLCLSHGIPIQDVMKMSGHADYKSMRPYIRVTRQHLRTVADRWNPGATVEGSGSSGGL
jgi:integrase